MILPYQVLNMWKAASIAVPAVPTATIVTTKTTTFQSTWYIGLNQLVTLDPGDGSEPDTIVGLGAGVSVNWDHNYNGLAGAKTIRITGALDEITFASLGGENITGFDFSLLTALQYLNIDTNQLTSIASVAGITALKRIWAYTNQITNISVLSTLPGLNDVKLGGCGSVVYTSITFPAWSSGTFRIDSCSLNSSEVDQLLIDGATSGWTNITVYVDGTNGARTSASDAALAVLLLAGCTIHVNE